MTSLSALSLARAPRWPRLLLRVDPRLRAPLSAQQVVVRLSLYLLLAANGPLWRALLHAGGDVRQTLQAMLAMALLLGCATLAVLAFTAWTRGMRWLWWLVLLIAALAQYYMLSYRVVIDPGMAANVLQTDAHEVADLLGWRMLAAVAAVMLLPTWWLARVRIAPMPWPRQLARNLALLALALLLAGVSVAALSRTLAPLMRNQPQLRYLMNPVASLYSVTVALQRQWFSRSKTLVPMTAGAALGTSYARQGAPALLVLVLGETARADHFGVNGYARETTPELARRGLLSWRHVLSCGTSTQASLPCMFSPLGKARFDARSDEYENLLDVVQAAGLAVLWIDNQSGCKGVCERVASAHASDGLPAAQRARLCPGGECPDSVLLEQLDARIAALPADKRQRGVLLVLHQMGSHGPAYYKRSQPEHKRFLPECRTEVLANCGQEALVNGYDNTIVATDAFLGQAVDWLQARQARYDGGLLYMSDHGESLGEYGLFLHGMPYAIAPRAQKHVPMLAWLSPQLAHRLGLNEACLRTRLDTPLTHDHLYSSVLGLLDLESPGYQRPLDALAPCRNKSKNRV